LWTPGSTTPRDPACTCSSRIAAIRALKIMGMGGLPLVIHGYQ
jgi:hypothetical protein